MKTPQVFNVTGAIVRSAVALILLLSAGPLDSHAYTVKGYEWGRSFDEVRGEIEKTGKLTEFNEKTSTLVFADKLFGKECKVSLLFTPKTRVLAGVAIIWSDPLVALEVLKDLKRKYGPPDPTSANGGLKNAFIWHSPVSRYDRIALLSNLNRTVLGYYGGDFYKRYEEEFSSKPGR